MHFSNVFLPNAFVAKMHFKYIFSSLKCISNVLHSWGALPPLLLFGAGLLHARHVPLAPRLWAMGISAWCAVRAHSGNCHSLLWLLYQWGECGYANLLLGRSLQFIRHDVVADAAGLVGPGLPWWPASGGRWKRKCPVCLSRLEDAFQMHLRRVGMHFPRMHFGKIHCKCIWNAFVHMHSR